MIKKIWIWYLQRQNKKIIREIRQLKNLDKIAKLQFKNMVIVRNIEVLKRG